MERLADLAHFKQRQNIMLEGFDPVSAGGFTQVPNCLINNKALSPSAKLVYAKLLSYAWHHSAVYPGQETMAAELAMTRPTVNKGVHELEREGLLEVRRRGQGLTNVYVLRHTVKRQGKRRG
jgi:DNA-binding MarR family transcriptional regulator